MEKLILYGLAVVGALSLLSRLNVGVTVMPANAETTAGATSADPAAITTPPQAVSPVNRTPPIYANPIFRYAITDPIRIVTPQPA